ncbi:MAG: competence protein ComEC family protein [Rhodobacteraceae bacterium]|nr:competence protein ComEC family protein [Paracoccaceae bacterium]
MILSRVLDRQRGHLFCWVPVCLALGIGAYFMLPVEPGLREYLWLAAALVLVSGAAYLLGRGAAPILVALALVGVGAGLAGLRNHLVAAPMLDFRYYGPVQGRLIAMDRSISDKTRLLFDQVVLSRVDPADTPARVRVSLHGDRSLDTALVPGKTLMLTAHLSAPRGPVEPGGFDFRRHAWFKQIGAVGYSRTPIMAVKPPDGSAWTRLQWVRAGISEAVRAQLPGQTGAFAAAVLTGDRSSLSRETVDEMRDTNLAHLLAISGLHMGLLTAVVFGFLRTGIALVPPLALRVNGKKWAACGALVAATGYLALSGGSVSTQRAFVMVAVMLCAILLDRRALTLRAVAIAACLILIFRPEALLGPGFQMSFAATTCLVWVFGEIRAARTPLPENARPPRWRRWLRPVAALVISSAVAGLATAPIGMAHFNTSATYGLPANLVAVPLMGSVVMPAAVFAGLLTPLGLEGIGLWIMGQGIAGILAVADTLSHWPDAVRTVRQPPGIVLPLIVLGALWAMLWQGRVRMAGLVPFCAAIWIWVETPRPDVLISSDGKLVGVMTSEGRALSRARGNGFAARAWLENDGDPGDPEIAHERWQEAGSVLASDRLHVLAKPRGGALRPVDGLCASGAILVADADLPRPGPCTMFDPASLRRTGAVALWFEAEEPPQILTVREVIGQRPWTPPEWWLRPDGSAVTLATVQ